VYETLIPQKRQSIENFSKYLNLDRKKEKVERVKNGDFKN